MILNKKKYTTGVYQGKSVFIAAMNEIYALISFVDAKSKLFKVDVTELTELK